MASPLEVFGKTAQRLSRNPLGIIALFIVLVYGIAGIVLGFSSQHLEPCERQPLIWFLVVFPVIVLAAFYRLVTCHHAKLYAPHDFQEDEGFFRAMSPIEQKQRLEEEIREVELASSVDRSERTTENETDALQIVDAVGVRHAWVLAEEVAIREIESEFGVPVQRQVAYGPDYGFDGIFQYKDKLAILEIKYLRRPNWRPMIESAIKHLQRAKDAVKPARVFVLAIVTDGLSETRREAVIQQTHELLKAASLDIDVRVYDFLELKRKYGLTNEVE